MSYLLAVSILICITFAVSILFKKKFEITLAPVIFLTIFLLYVSALANILPIGVYFVVGLGAVSLVFVLVNLIRHFNKTLQSLLSLGFFAFLIFVVLIWYGTRGRLLSGWDEFSHWGLTVKNMMYYDAFGNTENATTFFKGYPPSTALFQYFFTKLSGAYNEPSLYRAMDILLISMMLPLFDKLERKDWKKGILFCFVLAALPLVCTSLGLNMFTSICIDGFLGVLFAYLVYSCISFHDKTDWFFYTNFALGLFVLTLAKPSGLGFSLLALGILLANVGVDYYKRRPPLKKYLYLILPVLLLVFAKVSWNIHLMEVNVTEEWSNSSGGSITLSGILDVLLRRAPEYRYRTLEAFFNSLFSFTEVGPIKLSYMAWTALIAMIGMLTYRLSRDKDKRRIIKISTIGLVVSFFAYMAYMLLVYMFQFKEYEAVSVASFHRYTTSFVVGMLITAVFMLLYVLITEKKTLYPIWITCLIIAVFTPFQLIKNFYIYPQWSVSQIQKSRAQTAGTEYISRTLDPEKDRVFVIQQHSNGNLYWSTLYNSTPVRVSPLNTWSLGEKYDASDEWTTDISPEEWKQMLMDDYTYVYIASVDDRFVAQYGQFFEDPAIKTRGLYRIEKEDDLTIVFDTQL